MHENNLLRLRVSENINRLRLNLEAPDAEVDGRSLAMARTKLDEVEMWLKRAVPEMPEPKASMGATDDPRGRS